MLALVKKSHDKGASLENIEEPLPGPSQVLVKVAASSICGSDIHIYNWDEWASTVFKPPRIFGHEFCGKIVKVGSNVSNIRPGDFISGESHIPCLDCEECKSDRMHICDKLKILGVDINGSFAEYVVLPAICAWKHNGEINPDLGTLFEPLGNAVFCVQTGEVKGKTCTVLGCGPAGLFTIMVAKAMGARRVYAVEIDSFRMELAKEAGADVVLDGRSLPKDLKNIDVSFEMSGAQTAITQGLSILRNGGTFIAFGIPRQKLVQIDMSSEFILKGRRLIGVVGRHMFSTWKLMHELVNSKLIDPTKVITHRFPISEFNTAFQTRQNCGKIVMYPGR